MKCEQSTLVLHAFIDGELDDRRKLEFQTHVAECWRCTGALRDFQEIRNALFRPEMSYLAPASLRRRIEGALRPARVISSRLRGLLEGITAGSMTSTALAA